MKKTQKQKTNTIIIKKEKNIVKDYDLGMQKKEIKKKYKITDWEFARILKSAIHNETKIIIARPKHFKWRDDW